MELLVCRGAHFSVREVFSFRRSASIVGILGTRGWAGSVSAELFIAFVTKIPPPVEEIRQSYTDGSEGTDGTSKNIPPLDPLALM